MKLSMIELQKRARTWRSDDSEVWLENGKIILELKKDESLLER